MSQPQHSPTRDEEVSVPRWVLERLLESAELSWEEWEVRAIAQQALGEPAPRYERVPGIEPPAWRLVDAQRVTR